MKIIMEEHRMDYEALYTQLQSMEKGLKDQLSQLNKLSRRVSKEMGEGDLKGLKKDIAALSKNAKDQLQTLSDMDAAVDGFDSHEYLRSGDFSAQMLACCAEQGVDVKGEYPSYEMFPYRVKIEEADLDIFLDRKRVQCLRPSSFVRMVKEGRDKLMKAFFNEQTFVNELAQAYDLAVMKNGAALDSDIYLMSLYKFLAPMGRFRKDYDQQSYAFDLSRLYSSGVKMTKDGRRYQFGTSHKINKNIRFLDKNGHEQFFATIRFYRDEG